MFERSKPMAVKAKPLRALRGLDGFGVVESQASCSAASAVTLRAPSATANCRRKIG
jgi:hypothetical protein